MLTPMDVILNGIRNSLPDDPFMDIQEERRHENERFKWTKCNSCGKPFRDMGEIKCPYCKERR